ncbi:MAG: hypothetical protein C3F06_01055 [Candidatus Methanoperedenaceae archaeon]|nr:MAG: hypothetical protein C3F06_01055 [Candidatus Methanoperedenaceae archaeon]
MAKSLYERLGRYITVLVVVATLSVVLTVDSAQARIEWYDLPWTTVGSAGTVDEQDTSIYNVNMGSMDIKNTATLPASLDVRYNVVAIGQLMFNYPWQTPNMKVTYRDNGINASVTLYLREVNLTNGFEKTILTFRSNSFPSRNMIQANEVNTCPLITPLDFRKNAYYIDATISKIGTGGLPLLDAIQLRSDPCLI